MTKKEASQAFLKSRTEDRQFTNATRREEKTTSGPHRGNQGGMPGLLVKGVVRKEGEGSKLES